MEAILMLGLIIAAAVWAPSIFKRLVLTLGVVALFPIVILTAGSSLWITSLLCDWNIGFLQACAVFGLPCAVVLSLQLLFF